MKQALITSAGLAVFLCTGCGGGGDSSTAAPVAAITAARLAAVRQDAAVPSIKRLPGAVPSAATVSNDALMDWGERVVPQLFSSHATTQAGKDFVFRYYPGTDTYLAIATDGNVGVLQPRLTSHIAYLGSAGQFFCALTDRAICRPITVFQQGMGGYWAEGNYVVRDAAQWAQIWADRRAHYPTPGLGQPSQDPPTIDFNAYTLIGVSLGDGTDCGSFTIARVIEEAQALRVEYASVPLPPNMLCATVLAPINRFVLTARTDKPVYFVAVTM